MIIQEYGTKTVAQITGLTIRQLDSWQRDGLFTPSIAAARGSGSRSLYSYSDLIQLRLVAQLRKQGVSLQKIRKAMSFIKDVIAADKEAAPLLIFDKTKLWIVCKNHTADPIIVDANSGQQIMRIMIDQFADEIAKQVVRMASVTEIKVQPRRQIAQ